MHKIPLPEFKVLSILLYKIVLFFPRCTTCGEYIYKGRKFNSRKEDVDDMNHLGLRIYRFYIKVRLHTLEYMEKWLIV